MCAVWYYKLREKTLGPISSAELRRRAAEKNITPNTLVRKEPQGKWVLAREVKGLFAPGEQTGAGSPEAPKVDLAWIAPADDVAPRPRDSGPPAKARSLSSPDARKRRLRVQVLLASGGLLAVGAVALAMISMGSWKETADQEPEADETSLALSQTNEQVPIAGPTPADKPAAERPSSTPGTASVLPSIAGDQAGFTPAPDIPAIPEPRLLTKDEPSRSVTAPAPRENAKPLSSSGAPPSGADLADGRVARMRMIDLQLRKSRAACTSATAELEQVRLDLAKVDAQAAKLIPQLAANQAEAAAIQKDKASLFPARTPVHDRSLLACSQLDTVLRTQLGQLQARRSELGVKANILKTQADAHWQLVDQVLPELFWLCDPFGRFGPAAHESAIEVFSTWPMGGLPCTVPYLARGFANLNVGRYDDAIADLRKASELEESWASVAAAGRGLARVRMGDAPRSSGEFADALKRSPQSGIVQLFVAHARVAQKNYPEAERLFRQAVNLNGKIPQTHEALAYFLVTKRSRDGRTTSLAIRHATTACKLTKWEDWMCLDTLAMACAAAGDFETAAGWAKKAVERAPPQVRNVLHKRLALYQSGKPCEPE